MNHACLNKVFCALLLLCASLMAQAGEEIAVCFEDANVRPWRTATAQGLNFRLLEDVSRQTGIKLRFLAKPWRRCLLELKGNQIDAALGASWSAERAGISQFPEINGQPDRNRSLYVDRYIVVRRKSSSIHWDGKTFTGLQTPIGVQMGYSAVTDLRAQGYRVDDETLVSQDVLLKLELGRTDAVVMLQGEAAAVFAEHPKWQASLEILPESYLEKPYYLIFSRDFFRTHNKIAEALWAAIPKARQRPAYAESERKALDGLRRETGSKP